MKSFGSPKFNLSTTNLIKIEGDGYTVECRLKRTEIKFSIPKHLEGKDLQKESRKPEFEENLRQWIESKLQMKIVK